MSGELSVNFLGLELSSPVIVGSYALTIELETVRQLVNADADAIMAVIAGTDVVMVISATNREVPDAIPDGVDGIQHFWNINHDPTLQNFQESRPTADIGSEQIIRPKFVDPLTRSEMYFDPPPTTSQTAGNAFGHIRG